jgi:hypothetical protein
MINPTVLYFGGLALICLAFYGWAELEDSFLSYLILGVIIAALTGLTRWYY